MEILLSIVAVLALAGDVMLVLLLLRQSRRTGDSRRDDKLLQAVKDTVEQETDLLADQLHTLQGEISRNTVSSVRDLGTMLAESQRQGAASSTARLEAIDRAGAARQKTANDAMLSQLTLLENRLKNLEDSNATRLETMRGALRQGMDAIRADNNKKLDEIRGTVEEKLQSTLQNRISESFRAVSSQLEQVYKGLGEMQSLAADVGSLKQVLSGVKTRGILGEVQLGAILREILAPGQYEENVATVPGSSNRVEFAVRLPGPDGNVYLPIDAKFPGDTYAQLQAAREHGGRRHRAGRPAPPAHRAAAGGQGHPRQVHRGALHHQLRRAVPALEGLYAEVVSSGVTESLQRDYQIQRGGPLHHGGAAQRFADGLPHAGHPEALRRGLDRAGRRQDRV